MEFIWPFDLSAYFLSAFLMKKSHLSAPLNRGCLFFQIRVQGYAVKALIVFAENPRQLGTAKLGEIFPEGTLKHIHSVCALFLRVEFVLKSAIWTHGLHHPKIQRKVWQSAVIACFARFGASRLLLFQAFSGGLLQRYLPSISLKRKIVITHWRFFHRWSLSPSRTAPQPWDHA